ncbi:MAG TPA: right-handed parallel beta-helix repeat-containing protein, partial [Anaerolineales bacterium]|nr:right-handed parallel beta-helix repeat-containing protein [Anaerolineales bacterium]
MKIVHRFIPFVLFGLLAFPVWLAPPAGAPAYTTFGSDLAVCRPPLPVLQPVNPQVVTQCTQAGLQAALDQGGWVTFDCGREQTTIPLESQLSLSTKTDTWIDGGGLVTLDGQGKTRILYKGWHDPNTVGAITVRLQNIRLINGRAPGGVNTADHSGGALLVGHPGTRLHIQHVTFENNQTSETHIPDNQGGAIHVHNAYETVISASVFRNNRAGNGGAIGAIASGMLIYNSRFENNQALDDWDGGIVRGYGGALHLDGVTNAYNPDSNKTFQVCGSEFDGNTAIRGGGALASVVSDGKGTKLTIDRTVFTQNQAFGYPDPAAADQYKFGQGGALYHIEDDHAGANAEDNFEIRESLFHANQARRQGGAAWVSVLGLGRVVNSTFEGNSTSAPLNTVGQGGGMLVALGKIDFINTLFANNHAAYQAGALFGGSASEPERVITLTNSIFHNN